MLSSDLRFTPLLSAALLSCGLTGVPRASAAESGIYAGTFLIEPSLDIFFETDSNVLGDAEDSQADSTTVFRPKLKIDNSWSNLETSLFGELQSRRYNKYSYQDTDEYNVELSTRLDLAQVQSITLNLSAAESAERQNTAENFLGERPLVEDNQRLLLDYDRRAGLLFVGLGADYQTVRYKDSDFSEAPNDPRDRGESYLSIKAGLGEPTRQLFAGGRWGNIKYANTELGGVVGGDTSITEAFIGFRYDEAGPYSLSGEIGAYERDYDTDALETLFGIRHELRLSWALSYLTEVSITSSRSFEDSRSFESPGYDEISTTLSLSHQFTETLSLGSFYRWGVSRYEDIEIEDEFADYGLHINMELARQFDVFAGYDVETRERREGGLLSDAIRRLERETPSAGFTLRF